MYYITNEGLSTIQFLNLCVKLRERTGKEFDEDLGSYLGHCKYYYARECADEITVYRTDDYPIYTNNKRNYIRDNSRYDYKPFKTGNIPIGEL